VAVRPGDVLEVAVSMKSPDRFVDNRTDDETATCCICDRTDEIDSMVTLHETFDADNDVCLFCAEQLVICPLKHGGQYLCRDDTDLKEHLMEDHGLSECDAQKIVEDQR
jgi:hypothetical protein